MPRAGQTSSTAHHSSAVFSPAMLTRAALCSLANWWRQLQVCSPVLRSPALPGSSGQHRSLHLHWYFRAAVVHLRTCHLCSCRGQAACCGKPEEPLAAQERQLSPLERQTPELCKDSWLIQHMQNPNCSDWLKKISSKWNNEQLVVVPPNTMKYLLRRKSKYENYSPPHISPQN